MIAREWHCDAPECDHWTHAIPQPNPPHGWYLIDAGTGSGTPAERVGEFCSMDCVLKYASTYEPMEVIPFHDTTDGDS